MTTLTRVSNEAISFPLSATNPDGTPATVTGAKVALLLARRGPNAATVWTPATFSAGVVTVRLAGPDADPTGATLVVPEYKADLWALPLGITDYNPVKITRIYLLGGSGAAPATAGNPYVVSVAGLTGVVTTAALSAALGGTGGGGGISLTDHGDGTFDLSGSSVTDNGDGTYTIAA